jgi:hypothetical protein
MQFDNATSPSWQLEAQKRVERLRFPQPRFEPELYPSPESYQERLRRRDAWFELLTERRAFEGVFTIQFGRVLHDSHAEVYLLESFVGLLNEYWLGRRWRRYSLSERVQGAASIEVDRQYGNTHAHMLISRPPGCAAPAGRKRKLEEARYLSTALTQAARVNGICSPRGNVLYQSFLDAEDQTDAAVYMLKDFCSRPKQELFLTATV